MRTRLSSAVALFLCAGIAPIFAAEVLVYGPSLAPENCGSSDLEAHTGGCNFLGPNPLANEATVAADNGHNVTVVNEVEWAAMTQPEFAAFDAIVIGDAGCDFSNGEEMGTLNDTKAVWSPVVTGNVTVNHFDAFYHIYQSPEDEEGARALAGSGINFAASGEGTGLYFSNGCRSYGGEVGPGLGGLVTLDFLSLIGPFEMNTGGGGDAVTLVQPSHPCVFGATDANLSDWGSSTHGTWTQTPGDFELIATVADSGPEEPEAPEGGGDPGDVIYARGQTAPGTLEVPTLSTFALAGFALLLAGAAALRLRRA